MANGNLEQLIIDVKESLEREIGGLDRGLGSLRQAMQEGFAQVIVRFDTQAARLDRQGALLQVGSRWTARMNDWAEKIDAALEAKDREIAELRQRLSALEDKLH